MLLDKAHRVFTKLRDLAHAKVQERTLGEAWQDEDGSQRTPSADDLGVGFVEPDAEHYIKDAFAHLALQSTFVVEVPHIGLGVVRHEMILQSIHSAPVLRG